MKFVYALVFNVKFQSFIFKLGNIEKLIFQKVFKRLIPNEREIILGMHEIQFVVPDHCYCHLSTKYQFNLMK